MAGIDPLYASVARPTLDSRHTYIPAAEKDGIRTHDEAGVASQLVRLPDLAALALLLICCTILSRHSRTQCSK